MAQNGVIRARIDNQIKEEASIVLASIGLTPSDAYRMMMIRIAHEKKLPFEPLVPNEETIEAMREARNGKLKKFNSVETLFDDLHAN
jgi:DNA-damage-inducible protein J